MEEIHISTKDKTVTTYKVAFPKGYLNRSARRKWEKELRKDAKHPGVRIY